jgi:hypothetical protein
VKPFHFSTTSRGEKIVTSPFVPLAQQVQNIFQDRDNICKNIDRVKSLHQRKITVPQSPNLLTKHRIKTYCIPTSEEREMEAFRKIEPFKANPVNKKVTLAPIVIIISVEHSKSVSKLTFRVLFRS